MKDHLGHDAEFAELQHRFANKIKFDLPDLLADLERLNGTVDDRSTLQSLLGRLHRLAGSAGSFGFEQLGVKARELEQEVQQWLSPESRERYQEDYHGLLQSASALGQLLTEDANPSADTASPTPLHAEHQADRVSVLLLGADGFLPSGLFKQLEALDYRVDRCLRVDDIVTSDTRPGETQIILLDLDSIDPHHPALKTFEQETAVFIALGSESDFATRKACVQAGIPLFYPVSTDPTVVLNRIDQIVRRLGTPPGRVMIVDDDPELAELYRTYLQRAGMQARVVLEPERVLDHLVQFRPELILMDLHMPGISGSELATIIRQEPRLEALPIVFLSGEDDLDAQVEAIDIAEADDFLTKPIHAEALVASVRSRINRYRQISELMSRDSLTGLMTHARIKEAIAMEISRTSRRGSPACVAMLDLDDFKSVNDQFGHAAGDKVITALAMLLRHTLRQSDLKGRYGGEEFVVLLPDSPMSNAADRMEQVRQRFESLELEHGGQPLRCTVSIGLACTRTFPDLRGNDLIDQADKALYAAKAAGKNCLVKANRAASTSYEDAQ